MKKTLLKSLSGILIGSCVSCMLFAGTVFAESPFSGGAGTKEDPYQIETVEELAEMRNYLDADYVLTADLDLSEVENWEPVGSFAPKSDAPEDAEIPNPELVFSGTFDGNGHKISNVTVSWPERMAVGIFGCAGGTAENPAKIHDLTLENVKAEGAFLTGGLIGLQFMNCTVENITLTGENYISGMQGLGGIVGTGFDWIRGCSAEADIEVLGEGGACAGIIAGGTTYSSIADCTVTGGSITAAGNNCWGLGGLCGAPYAAAEISNSTVEQITITAEGTDNRLIGGLAGFAGTYQDGNPAQITSCRVEQMEISVSLSATAVGGIIGGAKEEMEGSDHMSAFSIQNCDASGVINGGKESVGELVGDPLNAEIADSTASVEFQ